MVLATCPNPADLERLYVRGLSGPEIEALEEHFQGCASCMERLKTLLRANDTLADALTRDTLGDELASGPVLAELMMKLEQLGPVSMKDGTQAMTPSNLLEATTGEVAAASAPARSLTDFLAPAESASELGRLGGYRIVKVLGHGGMGVVFQGEDLKLNRSVAIKAMLPALTASATAGERFLREARAMAAVEHDHIVRIYQVHEDRGVPFIAMEFLKGEPLEERLQREVKLPIAEIIRIGREIAEGLAAAHATGLIHRDVKPGNIWLEAPRGRVKILDFGLARAASGEADLTQQGLIVGTPSFMAPEQARGAAVDSRSDLFSLGVVLYRLCTGRQPFLGKDAVSTLVEVTVHQPATPIDCNPELPADLSELVMQLLAKEAANRPASARVVADRLHALEQSTASGVTLERVAVAAPTVARSSAGRGLVIAAVVVLVCLLPLGYFFGGTAVRIATNKGELVINSDDPNIEVTVKGKTAIVYDKVKDRQFLLTAGDYDVKVEVREKGEVTRFATEKFTITRNGTVTFDATLKLAQAPPKVPDAKAKTPKDIETSKTPTLILPLDAGWLEKVAAMPVDEQLAAVKAELITRNPKFDGKMEHKLDKSGAVTDVRFSADHVTDVSPVRAFTELRYLYCAGSGPNKGLLEDLSPLRGMKLVVLGISDTQVSNLSPVQSLPLIQIWFNGTQVSDLTALRDLKLTQLGFERTKIDDLSPLKNMKLVGLMCSNTPVDDLSPLQGMKSLLTLHCHDTRVSDLTPVKGARLGTVLIQNTAVSDLSPLRGSTVNSLNCSHTKVTNLTPLKETKISTLTCDFNAERDAAILRSIPTLTKINGKSVADLLP